MIDQCSFVISLPLSGLSTCACDKPRKISILDPLCDCDNLRIKSYLKAKTMRPSLTAYIVKNANSYNRGEINTYRAYPLTEIS